MTTLGNRRALREIDYVSTSGSGIIDNIMNVIHQLPPTPTSPEEEVIRLRGRKKTVQGSTDKFFPLNGSPSKSRLRSPRKQTPATPTRTSPRTPNKTNVATPTRSSPRKFNKQASTPSRTSPRKRLNLGSDDSSTSGVDAPQVKVIQPSKRRRSEKKPKPGNFEASLQALSHSQLVDLLKNLINKHPHVEQEIIEAIPAPDMEPLEQQLKYLHKNINKSFPYVRWGSTRDAFCFRRVRTHLEAFKKTCIDQGRHLVDSQHWSAVIDYVVMAWSYVLQMPDWDNPSHNKIKTMAFKGLAAQAMSALKKSKCYFERQELEDIIEREVHHCISNVPFGNTR